MHKTWINESVFNELVVSIVNRATSKICEQSSISFQSLSSFFDHQRTKQVNYIVRERWCFLYLGRSAIFCSLDFPRKKRDLTHLEMNCRTLEFTLIIQYPLDWTSFNAISLPACCVVRWHQSLTNSITFPFFGNKIGYLHSSSKQVVFILPPTLKIVLSSRKGSNLSKELSLILSARFQMLPLVPTWWFYFQLSAHLLQILFHLLY